ncbi:MAG: methyltransferase domain-containing protein [Candidatus Baltobacteraceae bacterium]
MGEDGTALTPPYFQYLIRLLRPFPNFDYFFIKPVRRKAVELLHLRPGDRVLDVGCGPGGSFPYLRDAVGPSGEVVGIEISPEVSVNARARIAKNKWQNIQVVESSAQTVTLNGTFDGLLMFAEQDVLACEDALENIFPYLREDARIVAFGAKTSSHHIGRMLNPVLQTLYKLNFAGAPRLDRAPWRLLAKRVEKLEIEEYFFGLMFLASGLRIPERDR